MPTTWYEVTSIVAIVFLSLMLFLALFEPYLAYKITDPPDVPIDSDEFFCILASLADASVHRATHIEVFSNGENYYEAELQALREARHHINIEAYIFQKGEIAGRFLAILTERARAGVRVNLLLDSVGSFATWTR